MKALYRGLLVCALQCAIVLTMTAKYAWDRERLPRAWTRVEPIDPNAPIRGRYLQLRLEVSVPDEGAEYPQNVVLFVENGQLSAKPDDNGALGIWKVHNDTMSLRQPVDFFLPDSASDPSRLKPGEELWVEVSVPKNALPRPIRLGIKKDGVVTPLNLR